MEKGGVIINYHNITYPDQNNGDGLRVVLWLSGCTHKCHGCQNPQTWDANSGIPFDEKAKEELFRELDKDYISGLTLTGGDPLHEANLDTILDIVTEFKKRYRTTQDIVSSNDNNHNILNRNPNKIRLLFGDTKTIWLYTGYEWNQLFNGGVYTSKEHSGLKRRNIVKQCDVLIDGRYMDSQRDITLKFRGSANQNVIDVQKSLQKGEIVLWCN